MTLSWLQFRYQQPATIAATLVERSYRPATINQALSSLRSIVYHDWKLGLMESENYQPALNVKTNGQKPSRWAALFIKIN